MANNKAILKATSLEELLVVLSVIGILTLVIMNAWRMMSDVSGRIIKGTDVVMEVFDSLAYNTYFIQDKLDKERMDSLMAIQNQDEETDDRLVEK